MAVSIGIYIQSLRPLQYLRLDTQELRDKHTMALYVLNSNLMALRRCLDLPMPLLNQVLFLAKPNPRGHQKGRTGHMRDHRCNGPYRE